MFRFRYSLLFWFAFGALAQEQTEYLIAATLDENTDYLTVSQTINWRNPTDEKVNIMYLTDWSTRLKIQKHPFHSD